MARKLEHAYKIHTLQLATMAVEKSLRTLWQGFGETIIDDPIQFFYIEGPEERIIVDVGGSADEINEFWPGTKDIQSFEDALGIVGLKPEDIDIILLSHMCFDHVLNARKCSNARVYIQEKELEYTLNPPALFRGTIPYKALRDLRFVPVQGDQEIVPGVKVIFLPGHTPGTQGVTVETKDGLAVITGFCCTEENFTDCPEPLKDIWNDMVPIGYSSHPLDAFNSMIRVKGLADIIIPQHGRKIPDVIG